MRRLSRLTAIRFMVALGCVGIALPSLAQVSVRSVKVVSGKSTVEIEVEASERIVPQTRVLTGPDRLVVDFPNAVPSPQVRSQSVDRGDVKNVRVGLFQGKPPVTRVVLDLKTARSYQIFPSGRTVTIKVLGEPEAAGASAAADMPASRPGFVAANYTTRMEPVRIVNSEHSGLEVSYHNGLLGIQANKVTLSEVLYAVQQRTGAEISIPAGAEQDKIAADFEPAPAPEVLARLLNGSRFNFLILSAPNNPRHLDRVILSPRAEGSVMPMPDTPLQIVQSPNGEEQAAVIQSQPNEVPAAPTAAAPIPPTPPNLPAPDDRDDK